jgi:excisionase family DNA binding protein
MVTCPVRRCQPVETDVAMTPEAAAEYLQLHLDTVRRLLRQGKLPGVKVGRQWRISKASLDKYLHGGGKEFARND